MLTSGRDRPLFATQQVRQDPRVRIPGKFAAGSRKKRIGLVKIA
jgi:hypothetical protein